MQKEGTKHKFSEIEYAMQKEGSKRNISDSAKKERLAFQLTTSKAVACEAAKTAVMSQ